MRSGMTRIAMVLMVLLVLVCAMCLPLTDVWATALTKDRNTPERAGREVGLTVASNVTIYAGAMVCENGSAKAVPAADSSGYVVVGKAVTYADNTGDNYSATKSVTVRRGVFRWVNGDSFTDANIGDLAYVEDDQTVQKAASASQDVVAGVIVDVDDDGVWVDTFAVGGQGAASVTTLSASGAAALASTLSVAGELSANGGVNCDGGVFTIADTTGNTIISGTVTVTNGVTMLSTLSLTGALTANGGANFDGGKFTIADTTANTIISGTLTTTGAVSFASTLGVTGATTLTGGGTSGDNFDAASHRVGGATLGVYTNGVLDGWLRRNGVDLEYIYAPGGTESFTNQLVDDVTQ